MTAARMFVSGSRQQFFGIDFGDAEDMTDGGDVSVNTLDGKYPALNATFDLESHRVFVDTATPIMKYANKDDDVLVLTQQETEDMLTALKALVVDIVEARR